MREGLGEHWGEGILRLQRYVEEAVGSNVGFSLCLVSTERF